MGPNMKVSVAGKQRARRIERQRKASLTERETSKMWAEVPANKYRVIYCDPPWQYRQTNTSVAPPYPTLSIQSMAACIQPLQAAHPEGCLLLMWTSGPMLDEAIELMRLWGFKFRTVAFVWHKVHRSGKEATCMGDYPLSSCEFVLAGASPGLAIRSLPKHNTIRQFLEAPRRQHSVKPDEVMKRIEDWFGVDPEAVPKLEIFSRRPRPGWDAWGNDVEGESYFKAGKRPKLSKSKAAEKDSE